jgi:DeoR family glycerol-3-phosphate regulon repressor
MAQSSVRQSEILKLVRQRGSCGVAELAQRLAVSEETIRRNVKPLVARGLVVKVHGGIVLPETLQEPPIQRRMLENQAEKTRIAQRVAREVKNGDTLMLDAGSTTAYVARALANHNDLTVVTNSSPIAHILASNTGNRVFLAGGELRAHDAAAFGSETTAFVRRFQVHWSILSVGSLDAEHGFMDYHLCEADLARVMTEQAERSMVAADSSKFGRKGLVEVCAPELIDTLVTEALPSSEILDRLREGRVELLLAEAAG